MAAMRDIRKYSDTVAHEFRPARIILFGSHARGDASEDSDVDLLVIIPYRGHAVHKAIEIRQRVRADFPLDLVVRAPREVRWRLKHNDWFLREIMEQGKVLYESPDRRVGRKSRR